MTAHKELPAEVRELAQRLGANTPSSNTTVHLRQSGRMRQDAKSGWMRFRAQQTILVESCAFDWRAQVGPGGLVRVSDELGPQGGRLRALALGFIPVASAGGNAQVTRGELMRYLAELPWAPDAILQNRQLDWKVEAPDRFVVAAGEGESSAKITLGLDAEGRIASTFAPDRPRAVGKGFVPTPWRGRFFDYRLQDDRWLPFRGEIGWIVGGRDVVCWEGQLTDWFLTSRDPGVSDHGSKTG